MNDFATSPSSLGLILPEITAGTASAAWMAAQPREPDSDTVLPQAVSDISSYIVRTYSYLLLESWNAAFLVRLEKYTERSNSIREVVGHLSENVNFTVGGFQKWLENSLARQSTNTQSQLIDLNSFSPSPSEYAPAPRLQARHNSAHPPLSQFRRIGRWF